MLEDEEEGIGDEDDRKGVGSSGEESYIVPQYISDPRQHQQYWLQRIVSFVLLVYVFIARIFNLVGQVFRMLSKIK